MMKILLAASCFIIAIASPVSPATAAYYEDWYLDCTIVEKSIPVKIIGYYYDQLFFKDIKAVKIHMGFDNGGNLGVEGVEIKYINETNGDSGTPLSLFNIVRFDGGKQLVAGVVTWRGSEPRSYVHGWSMTGEVKVKWVQSPADASSTYTETFFRKNRIVGRMLSTCVSNNPN